jgi:uncharacterized protein YraI
MASGAAVGPPLQIGNIRNPAERTAVLLARRHKKREEPIMKTTLLAAASALVLSAGMAAAAPAVTASSVNVRSGPGTQYQVIGSLPGNATIDFGGCDGGGWCQISSGGYVNAAYLQFAGSPGPVASGVYDDYGYGPDYGYNDGPDVGVYATPGFYGPGFRHRRHWSGNWQQGGPGNWQHNRPPVTAQPSQPQPGPRIGQVRGAPQFRGAPMTSAPVGLRTGGPTMSGPRMGPSAPHVSAPAGRSGGGIRGR